MSKDFKCGIYTRKLNHHSCLFFHNSPKDEKHEGIATDVLPGCMAKSSCKVLPPARAAVMEIQGCHPVHMQGFVSNEEHKVQQQEGKHSIVS